jgi:short-subunit dehydrogenase
MPEQPRLRALVTGASAGIGEGFARRLASDGYDLVLVARRAERLGRLADELSGRHRIQTEVVAGDLARGDGVGPIEKQLSTGKVDLLVNNAGFGTVGEFASLPLERELEELDLNVRALMRLCHAALGPMIARGSGGIINVASTAAYQPVPFNATYAASKAFVLHFSEALHEEVRGRGVTVTCLCPGPVRTEFQRVAGVDEARVPSIAWTSVEAVVDAALSALRGRRAIAIPGVVNVISAASVRLAPRLLVRRLAGSMFRNVRQE